MIPTSSAKPAETPKLASRLRGSALMGAVVIFGFMGGFAVWAATAPLSAGATIHGSVGPEGSRKVLQHLEGGIVREVLVRNGDLVKKGQPVLTLERAQAQSAFGQIRNTLSRRMAEAARLAAQASGAAVVDFSRAEAVAGDDANFADFVEGQRALFVTEMRDQKERQELLQTQSAKLRAAIDGNAARVEGSKEQRRLIDVEITDTQGLFDKGLARKPQMLALQRRRSELDTEIAGLNADSRRAEIEIAEKEVASRNQLTAFANETATELAKARGEVAGLEARLVATADMLTRTQVLAPETGYVLNLQAKTIGGVIRPGQDILEIVPTEGDLVIEGRVSPQEIRNIAAEQPARVSFLTFAQRDMPMIPGRVLQVAADAMTDPQTRETYYTAKIAVDRSAFAAYAKPEDLKPGTPVEAYVEARTRVAAEYFVDPLVHSFRKSFREQ